MFVKIHTPHSLPGGDNKGSSIRLVEYLEKENKGKIEQELFFNHQKDAINKDDVISKIDNNNKKGSVQSSIINHRVFQVSDSKIAIFDVSFDEDDKEIYKKTQLIMSNYKYN